MHKVYLFGSGTLGFIPDVIENHISEIIKQTNGDVEFIVGDKIGAESGFHKVLSAVGGRQKTKIYSVGYPSRNTYELPTKVYSSEYNAESKTAVIKDDMGTEQLRIEGILKEEDIPNRPEYFDFLNKQMCRDCTFAICYWDGKSKNTLRNIDRLKAQGKYVYVYTAQL
jgi:hypothetical protein